MTRGEVALNDYALKFRSGTDAWHTMWFQSGGLFVKENEGLEFQMGLGLNKIKFTSDGNVGIGTLDPDAKLDLVNNPGSTNNLALATNSYPNAYRWRFNTVDRGMAIDLDFTVSNNLDNQETILQLSHSGSGRPELKVENNWLVINNSNLGIGTVDPDAKLDIFGNSGSTTNLILSANYPNSYRWRMNTVDRGGAIDLDFTASNAQDIPETIMQLSRSNTGRPQVTITDVYSAGGKNLLLGDDAYLSDVDQANTLGIYGNQNSATGKIRLGGGGATIEGKSNGDICIGVCN